MPVEKGPVSVCQYGGHVPVRVLYVRGGGGKRTE